MLMAMRRSGQDVHGKEEADDERREFGSVMALLLLYFGPSFGPFGKRCQGGTLEMMKEESVLFYCSRACATGIRVL